MTVDIALVGRDQDGSYEFGFATDLVVAGARYKAGMLARLRLGTVDLAEERGEVVCLRDVVRRRKVKVRIDMTGFGDPAHAGVNVNGVAISHGQECELPFDEAMRIVDSGRARGASDDPMGRFLTARGELMARTAHPAMMR